MKKLVALLLVVAFLFGFGAMVVDVVGPAVAGPGDVPPPVWPPVNNSISPTIAGPGDVPPPVWPPVDNSIGRG
ncbi:MAG: hypothetical protein ACM3WU_07655 [Bacillota bacterium]